MICDLMFLLTKFFRQKERDLNPGVQSLLGSANAVRCQILILMQHTSIAYEPFNGWLLNKPTKPFLSLFLRLRGTWESAANTQGFHSGLCLQHPCLSSGWCCPEINWKYFHKIYRPTNTVENKKHLRELWKKTKNTKMTVKPSYFTYLRKRWVGVAQLDFKLGICYYNKPSGSLEYFFSSPTLVQY